jgi:hypothetical protein
MRTDLPSRRLLRSSEEEESLREPESQIEELSETDEGRSQHKIAFPPKLILPPGQVSVPRFRSVRANDSAAKQAKGTSGCVRPSLRPHKPPLASLGTYLGALYQRLRKRMGLKCAIMALAHRILISLSHLLKEQQPPRELEPGHAQEQANEASKRWALRRLQQLGFQVPLQSVEVASHVTLASHSFSEEAPWLYEPEKAMKIAHFMYQQYL